MIFIKWHLIQSNFIGQISFQLSNTLLLATIPQNTLLLATIPQRKRRYEMTEHNLLKLMKSGNLLNLMKSGKNNSKWDLKLLNIC